MEEACSTVLNPSKLQKDFRLLRPAAADERFTYLDSAATSLTPEPVVDAMNEYYREFNASVHRGLHGLSQRASERYERAHDRVAEFIDAPEGREEVIFTKNATEAMNLVAYAWGLDNLGRDDAVVLTELEHHSTMVTWQHIAEMTGATVKYVSIDDSGALKENSATELIDDAAAVVCIPHVSNVLGTETPCEALAELAHDAGALLVVDGTQAVPHMPIDIGRIGADFYTFSGHKMCGPTGIGVLYGRRELLSNMRPFLLGGGMVEQVTLDDRSWNPLPWKFEAGTPPIAEALGLSSAIDYLDAIGLERIKRHDRKLARRAREDLRDRVDIEVYGPPDRERLGVLSFNLKGVHAHNLSGLLDEHGVAIRAGNHCAEPLHRRLGIEESARASFYLYNSTDDVDHLLDAVAAVRELLLDGS